jgi:hypothetical protein
VRGAEALASEMAETEEDFPNPLAKAGDSGEGATAFESEVPRSGSPNVAELKAFEDEADEGSTAEWGNLAAGEAMFMGDIDKAILVRGEPRSAH